MPVTITTRKPGRPWAICSTWMRLLEHMSDIREPEYLPGWLKVTARREARALTMLRRALGLPGPAGQVIDARGVFELGGSGRGLEPAAPAA